MLRGVVTLFPFLYLITFLYSHPTVYAIEISPVYTAGNSLNTHAWGTQTPKMHTTPSNLPLNLLNHLLRPSLLGRLLHLRHLTLCLSLLSHDIRFILTITVLLVGCYIYSVASIHLAIHELVECSIRVRRQLFETANFGYAAVATNADDEVRTLDCAETMGDGDGGVVAAEKSIERFIYEGFGLGVLGKKVSM